MRKVLSLIFMGLGVGIFIFGTQMSNQAQRGEERISQAEENVEGRRQPLIGPIRKSVIAKSTENAQEKIGEAKQEVGKSQVTAYWLQGTGIVLFVIGLGCFFSSFFNRKH